MRSVLRWVLRRGSLYLLLVLALAFGPLVWHASFGGGLRSELMSPAEVSREFQRVRQVAAADFRRTSGRIADYPASAVEVRLSQAQVELVGVSAQLQRQQGWLASIRPRMILERKELELRQAALRGEVQLLERARERHTLRTELAATMSRAQVAIEAARRSCDAANAEARQFNARSALERSVRNALRDEARRLTEQARRGCDEYGSQRRAALEENRALQARLAAAQAGYARADREGQVAISRVAINLTSTVHSVLVKAAILLAGIILMPYAIRLLFYFVLAPLAERRAAVRLPRPNGSAPVSLEAPQRSVTSAPIKLGAGEELLVRQGFLQTTSSAGAKATRALLDWRHPFSSLASGLAFLTRIRGDGETTTVSAVHDPFAEVAVLDLPAGSACVLQPRALVAVVQPTERPLRITTHWRIGSLHAWLTLQLRYLMFHGPARLVIKGGRGVRIERAERGRVFGQDQLVGFSPDLAYSVTRTETFWPYFIGLEPLLKDKVEAGGGILIIEEAPVATGGRASSRKGLEGAADALLKAVGL